MNEMFKRIAALLDGQAASKTLLWGPAAPQAAATSHMPDKRMPDDDFCDTDIAVAWLCEASNRTRTAANSATGCAPTQPRANAMVSKLRPSTRA